MAKIDPNKGTRKREEVQNKKKIQIYTVYPLPSGARIEAGKLLNAFWNKINVCGCFYYNIFIAKSTMNGLDGTTKKATRKWSNEPGGPIKKRKPRRSGFYAFSLLPLTDRRLLEVVRYDLLLLIPFTLQFLQIVGCLQGTPL